MENPSIAELCALIDKKKHINQRTLLAIAGPPASGKSYLSHQLSEIYQELVCVVPMDGYHLENDELNQLGLLNKKGAPETFNAKKFVQLIYSIHQGENVRYSVFDRQLDCCLEDAEEIQESAKIIIVEGNYLLLNTPIWENLMPYWDIKVWVNTEIKTLKKRLVNRWLKHGYSLDQAKIKAEKNDLVNVKYVLENSVIDSDTICY